jgi:hypothetical protein
MTKTFPVIGQNLKNKRWIKDSLKYVAGPASIRQ